MKIERKTKFVRLLCRWWWWWKKNSIEIRANGKVFAYYLVCYFSELQVDMNEGNLGTQKPLAFFFWLVAWDMGSNACEIDLKEKVHCLNVRVWESFIDRKIEREKNIAQKRQSYILSKCRDTKRKIVCRCTAYNETEVLGSVFKCRFFYVILNGSDSYKTPIYRHQFCIRNEFDNVRLKWLSCLQNANFDQICRFPATVSTL